MSVFSALEANVGETRRLFLQHPFRAEPLRNVDTEEPAWIDLLPDDSDVARKHARVLTDKSLKAGKKKLDAEDFEVSHVEKLISLTKGWSLVGPDGKALDVPFNAKNARELYTSPGLAWIRRQVEEFVVDVGNWMRGNSTT